MQNTADTLPMDRLPADRRTDDALVERGEAERTGAIASAAHLAYHLGAIRQIDRATRGPTAAG